jgi:hypothetical protein
MGFQKYIFKSAIGFSIVYLSACAASPTIPVGIAESYYKQEGIVESYYEQVTASNSYEMQEYLNDKTKISKWHNWDTWEPKVKFLPEDEIWYFTTDPKSWKNNAGRMGFCVFRNGEVITRYITIMN